MNYQFNRLIRIVLNLENNHSYLLMHFNLFKSNPGNDIKPTTKVYRKEILEGYAIPAIIHNMNYFFVDLDVYENGRVHCWNFEDFDHFVNDVKRGWVVIRIPDGEDISIHGLGTWTIGDGKWFFNSDTFIAYVRSLIKELNPKSENIYKYSVKKSNGIRIGENGDGTVYKEQKRTENDPFPRKLDGDSVDLYYRIEDDFHLAKITVFADDTIHISRLETPIETNLAKFEKLIDSKLISTSVPVGATVQVYGLGSFSIKSASWCADIEQKLVEIKDMLRKLKGQPSSIEICRQALEDYRENPTIANRDKLRGAYESIAEHERLYVGDMDTKDIEVRMIIYGEHEIENWSHYQLAKERGEDLPSIKVQKAKDEDDIG
jgi:hypothetical protein